MKLFKLNKDFSVVCQVENTRNGFRHKATLLENGNEVDSYTINYINRTWETYEYQSVLKGLIYRTDKLTVRQKENFLKKL